MAVTATQVKELRDRTNAGIMDCKKVLVETDGDIDKAIELLRERGIAKAAKKAGRVASEGLVEAYVHGGKYGALVEVNSETDFVSNNDDFKQFVKDIAMHIAATGPKYVKREDVPAEVVEKEKETLKAQALNEGKPEDRIEQILVGKVNKFYEEVCLENQIFIKAENKETVGKFVEQNGGKLIKMVRYEVGEGMEKRNENFAEEVANQING